MSIIQETRNNLTYHLITAHHKFNYRINANTIMDPGTNFKYSIHSTFLTHHNIYVLVLLEMIIDIHSMVINKPIIMNYASHKEKSQSDAPTLNSKKSSLS